MFRNYLHSALRSLAKNKVSSLINVFGLTTGLSACLLIGLYIQDELRFDAFQANGNRIVRLIMEYSFGGNGELKRVNATSTKVAPVFARTFPEVEAAVRMKANELSVRYGDKLLAEKAFLFADSSFLRVFHSPVRMGNPRQALSGPYKVMLTESTAKRYFGSDNPLGKTLLIGSDKTPYQVTGILADYPANSQIKFDFLASFSSLKANQEETYFEANYTTYLLLKQQQSVVPLQAKITAFMKKEMAGGGSTINFLLEPFDKIHLYSDYEGFVPNTSITYLYILSAVAGLILLIVGFTYINLSTARSLERAREVGIRKVVGAHHSQLFWQFIGESGLVCGMAMLVSLLIAVLVLPAFNEFIQKQLSLAAIFSPSFLGFVGLMTLLISLLSGSYPALVLSGFQPVRVLKGAFRRSDSGQRIQQSLIVFQFAISVGLIVSTLIIQQQLHFIQHKKLGYDREHVLVLPINEQMLATITTLKQELKTNSAVRHVSHCISSPVQISGGYNMRTATMPGDDQIAVTATPIDEEYVQATGLQVVAGQDLTEQDMQAVSSEKREERLYQFMLNESAARQLGWSARQAIGKKLVMGYRSGVIKAVIRDFHFESMHTAIKPVVLFPERRARQLLVKVSGQHMAQTIAFLENKWKQVSADTPFTYRFLDEEYRNLYRSERQLGTIMNLFSGLAIVLACLGLLGLSSYIVQQRLKEIGIRKLLGASSWSIIGLVSADFIKLVGLALLVGFPLAYGLMAKWLANFAYPIEVSGWQFVLTGLLALGITLLTVSFQSFKAALTNPVKSLRSE